MLKTKIPFGYSSSQSSIGHGVNFLFLIFLVNLWHFIAKSQLSSYFAEIKPGTYCTSTFPDPVRLPCRELALAYCQSGVELGMAIFMASTFLQNPSQVRRIPVVSSLVLIPQPFHHTLATTTGVGWYLQSTLSVQTYHRLSF